MKQADSLVARARHHPSLGWVGGGEQRVDRAGARHRARGDRHQRRRQVDAHQHALGRVPAVGRGGRADGPGRHRLDAATARACWARTQLPAQHDLPELHGLRELPASGAGARAEALGDLAARRPLPGQRAAGQGSGHACRPRQRCSSAWRACCRTGRSASSRSRCAWRRSPQVLLLDEPLGRHGRRGNRTDAEAAGRVAAGPCDPAGRARHGRRVPHRRPYHGDGERLRSSPPAIRTSSATARRSGRPILARDTDMATAGDLLLDAQGVHAWYGSSHVLHGIDLKIARGQTIGLLGRNGMGKSTLIRTLLGHVTPARRAHRLLRPERLARQAARGGAPGRSLRARGARRVPQPDGAREPDHGVQARARRPQRLVVRAHARTRSRA